MIEDTSFIIDVLNGEAGALEYVSIAEAERTPEKISAVTLLELQEGVVRSTHPSDEKEAVLNVLDSKIIVPADAGIMRRAGQLSGQLADRGDPIDREDCIVAATALREDEPVVTRNVEHFERVPDLRIREY